MMEILILALLLVLAVVVVVGSILYRISEIREDEAAWDALISRTRRGR